RTAAAHPKDAINDHVVAGTGSLAPDGVGTKAAAWYRLTAGPGETRELRLRLTREAGGPALLDVPSPSAIAQAPSAPPAKTDIPIGTADPLRRGFETGTGARDAA